MRSLLFGGIDPLTTLTLGPSSFVPCPKELSPDPLARSIPLFRPETVSQSVVPYVVGDVRRFPSPPAKVLGLSGPRQLAVVPVGAKSQPPGRSAKLTGAKAKAAVSAPAAPSAHILRRLVVGCSF